MDVGGFLRDLLAELDHLEASGPVPVRPGELKD
jgi:hypothetical protein